MGSLVLKDDSLNLVPLDHGAQVPGLCFGPRSCGLLDEGTIHNLEVRCPPSTKAGMAPSGASGGGDLLFSPVSIIYTTFRQESLGLKSLTNT